MTLSFLAASSVAGPAADFSAGAARPAANLGGGRPAWSPPGVASARLVAGLARPVPLRDEGVAGCGAASSVGGGRDGGEPFYVEGCGCGGVCGGDSDAMQMPLAADALASLVAEWSVAIRSAQLLDGDGDEAVHYSLYPLARVSTFRFCPEEGDDGCTYYFRLPPAAARWWNENELTRGVVRVIYERLADLWCASIRCTGLWRLRKLVNCAHSKTDFMPLRDGGIMVYTRCCCKQPAGTAGGPGFDPPDIEPPEEEDEAPNKGGGV